MEHQANGHIRPHHSKLAFFYRISDALIILAVLYLSAWSYGISWSQPYLEAAYAGMILFYLFGESVQIYRSWRGVPVRQFLQPVLFSWILTVFVLLLLAYVTKTTGTYSRVTIGIWMTTVPLLLIAWRLAVRFMLGYFRSRGFNSRRVVIAGANEQAERLARLVQSTPALGMRLAGFFDDRDEAKERIRIDLPAPILGDFDELVKEAKKGGVDLVYIALPMKGEERIGRLITALSDTTSSVYIMPDFFVFDLLHSRWVNVGEIPTVSIFESPFYGVEGWSKRLEDLILASLIVLLISLPMLLIAIGVKLSSPGPVLFKQARYGLDGRRIQVWKFRSMTVSEDGSKVVQAKKGDARITPFGAFLRKTSLDELPQFFNVLMGDMSIVGPRPHAVAHNEEYRKLIAGYMLRHKVKPGITGWAQINGWRGETDTLDKMEKRIEYDLWYIRRWSVLLDLKIIFKTMFKGFSGQNAY